MALRAEVKEGARRLRAGGLVAFPTETVYGLGADALNAEAVARVYAVKGRPAGNPLIVHVSDPEMARRVVSRWPLEADQLAGRFWPGPLTLVLPRAADLPGIVTSRGATVGVRVPDHPLALALIEMFGGPIVGPSANPSGYVSPTTAEHVRGHYDEASVYVLDGGACRAGIESTVLDLAGDRVSVLRKGVIGAGEIAEVLGCEIGDPGDGGACDAAETAASPGVLGPHYQPRARVLIVERQEGIADAVERAGGRAAVLSAPGRAAGVESPNVAFQMPASAAAYAGELYAALREADASQPAVIIAVLPRRDDSPIWSAVRDRLLRAAAPGV